MKVYTVENGKVAEGVRVDSFTLKGAGVTIPAIIVGEEGRGRKLGVLPVQLRPEQYKNGKRMDIHIFIRRSRNNKGWKA